jgi:hypothetical protein
LETVHDFEDLLELFERYGVRSLIIGGLAFTYHAMAFPARWEQAGWPAGGPQASGIPMARVVLRAQASTIQTVGGRSAMDVRGIRQTRRGTTLGANRVYASQGDG